MATEELYKRTAWALAAGVLVTALGEAIWAQAVGSHDLFKDAGSFGYDVALNAVAAFVFGRGARLERMSAYLIAGLLAASAVDGALDLWTDLQGSSSTSLQETVASNVVATAVSCLSALALLRFRADANPLIRATWLNARNDAASAILSATVSLSAVMTSTQWLEHTVDLVGIALSLQAAASVLSAALQDPHTPSEDLDALVEAEQ